MKQLTFKSVIEKAVEFQVEVGKQCRVGKLHLFSLPAEPKIPAF